jgi:hypothetical protein
MLLLAKYLSEKYSVMTCYMLFWLLNNSLLLFLPVFHRRFYKIPEERMGIQRA